MEKIFNLMFELGWAIRIFLTKERGSTADNLNCISQKQRNLKDWQSDLSHDTAYNYHSSDDIYHQKQSSFDNSSPDLFCDPAYSYHTCNIYHQD